MIPKVKRKIIIDMTFFSWFQYDKHSSWLHYILEVFKIIAEKANKKNKIIITYIKE